MTALALPAHAHVPGTGSMPDMAPLEAAKALALPVTRREIGRGNPAYLYGHDLFDSGFYWEAHEVWEAVWLNCPPNSVEKLLLRMLIQQANARLKLAMGRPRAAQRLADEARTLRAELQTRLDGEVLLMGVNASDDFAL